MNCKCLGSCSTTGRFNLPFCILWLFWCGFNDFLNRTSHSPQQLGKSLFCYFEHEGESCYGLCGWSLTAVLLSAVAPARGTQRVQCAERSSRPTFSKWLCNVILQNTREIANLRYFQKSPLSWPVTVLEWGVTFGVTCWKCNITAFTHPSCCGHIFV